MAAPTDFKSYILTALPVWLRDPAGIDALHAGMGDAKDSLVSRAKDSVYARFPLYAPTDALLQLGVERGIPRGVSETDAAYAIRLQQAWTTWPQAGTPAGVLNALKYAGYTAAVVQFRKLGFSLSSSGALVVTTLGNGGWRFDSSTTNWNRFSVLILPPFPVGWFAASPPVITYLTAAGVGSSPITSSTQMTVDARIIIQVIATGAANSAATYKYSLDNGATYSGTVTPAALVTALAPYVAIAISATVVNATEVFYISPAFTVPADGAPEPLFIKSIVNKWKPVAMNVASYVIQKSGQMLGWPATNVLNASGANTAGGGTLRLGGATQTLWGP